MADLMTVERTIKAFANRRRLAIVSYLKLVGSASVGDISRRIRLSFKSTSNHLSVLSAAGVLDKEQIGLTVMYSLASPRSDDAAKAITAIL